jgi:hypothetical protein
MDKIIVVAGANGNLGKRICIALIEKGAKVKALLRKETNSKTIEELETLGAEVYPIDYSDTQTLTDICKDAHCVVSAFAGLEEVIIKTQKKLLKVNEQFDLINFSELSSATTTDKKWMIFKDKTIQLIDKIMPNETIYIKMKDFFPWIDNDLLYIKHLRDAAYKRYKKSNNLNKKNLLFDVAKKSKYSNPSERP